MISVRRGTVIEILAKRTGLTEVKVELEGDVFAALNYDELTGDICTGDEVLLNTTALELELGTGGKHIVLWNLRHGETSSSQPGHIMKLRYTPLQMKCLSVEEQESPHHQMLQKKPDLQGMPVIVGTLHSQLPAVALTIKKISPETKIAYIMTDGGALPLAFSNLVHELKDRGAIGVTITVGHAFGGDLEAVNVYSGLMSAKAVAQADVALVVMGPGIVGTDTPLGFSGVEQGEIINAAGALRGTPIAIPRVSFKDKRPRHRGVSHHTLTALSLIALVPCTIPIPKMSDEKMNIVLRQLRESGVAAKHQVEVIDNDVTLGVLEGSGLEITTMGRTVREDPEFFQTAGTSGLYAVKTLRESTT